VRYECLGLLDHLAEEESVPAMIAATSDSVPRVRRMAVHALGCQGCKQSSLCADLNAVFLPIAEHDPAWKVRREAVISIVQQDASERSRATLRKLAAADPHATVRKQACWALGLQERGMRTD
jgi:HEAT repeat protein